MNKPRYRFLSPSTLPGVIVMTNIREWFEAAQRTSLQGQPATHSEPTGCDLFLPKETDASQHRTRDQDLEPLRLGAG